MGAVVASIYGEHLPFLGTLGLYKEWTFGITAGILTLAGWILYRPGRICPTDPKLAIACNTAHTWNVRFFWGAVVIWCIGAFAAFVMPYLYH